MPLPQDNVVLNGSSGTGTIAADMPRMGADITCTGYTGTLTTTSVENSIHGSLTLAAGMTYTGTQNFNFHGRGTHTITSAGKTMANVQIRVHNAAGSYTLQDALVNTGANGIVLWNSSTGTGGTFSTNGMALTTPTFASTATHSRTLTITNSTITLTSTATFATWSLTNASLMTLNASGSTIVFSEASANTRTFDGAGKTYGTLTYTVATSTGALVITGSNTFNTINFSDASNARTLKFTAGTTTTITGNFNVNGTAGKLMSIESATAATHTLSKTTGIISCDYLSITNSIATGGASWFAGANSTNVSGNQGWVFTAPTGPSGLNKLNGLEISKIKTINGLAIASVKQRNGLGLPAATPFNGHASLTTSLVAYWELEESSGTRVDVHGGNDVTDNATVTQQTGKLGQAAQFTAANSEYLSKTDNAALSTGDIDFTFAAWVYLDSKANNLPIVSKYAGGAQSEYALLYRNAVYGDRFGFIVRNDPTETEVQANNLGSPSISTWYFVVGWHDSSANTINIQVNNGTVDSAAHSAGAFDSTSAFQIGALTAASYYMDGRIDEVGFWKKVLTAQERTDLYNNGSGLAY